MLANDLGLTPYYAQTAWPSNHRDSRNSGYAPFPGPNPPLRTKWTALDGSIVLQAVTTGSNGTLYATTGQATGPNLFAFDRDGNLLWSSDLLDPGALANSPIPDVNGDIYVGDADECFAFYPNGTLKWRVFSYGTFITPVLTVDGYIVGITSNATVVVLNRTNGSLAAPTLNLTCDLGPPGPAAPRGLWAGPGYTLMDPALINATYWGMLGYEARVTNTPAVNPVNNRIYMPTGDGHFYGIDFSPGNLTVACNATMGAGSATSPVISPDGSHIYVADMNGTFYAFDKDCNLAWTFGLPGGVSGAPSVGSDGTIYSLGGGYVNAIADRGTYAELLWRNNFTSVAEKFGYPVSRADSIISVTDTFLYVAAILGKIFTHGTSSLLVPMVVVVLALNPIDGTVVGPPARMRDTCEGFLTIDSDGSIYATGGSMSRSIAYYWGYMGWLPPELQVPLPIGGIQAYEPVPMPYFARNVALNYTRSVNDSDPQSYAYSLSSTANFTFSAPDANGVINITLPKESMSNPSWFNPISNVTNEVIPISNGYGKLYTLNNTGDVDIKSMTNDTGMFFWKTGAWHPAGVEWIGDGTPDPAGSSWMTITYNVSIYWGNGTHGPLLGRYPFRCWYTTGFSENTVVEPASRLNGSYVNKTGVPYSSPFVCGVVTYVFTEAYLNIPIYGGPLDVQAMEDVTFAPQPSFMVTGFSPINLYITDPINRHIGTHPTTGESINEISGAFYSGPGSEPQRIVIPDPLDGVYDIRIIGTSTGAYTLVVDLATLEKITTDTYTGNITAGQILESEANISEGEMTSTSPSTPPVGGIYIPVNKLELLAPYIELTILLAVAVTTVIYVRVKKKKVVDH